MSQPIRIIVNGTGAQIKVTASSPNTTVVDQQPGPSTQQMGGTGGSGATNSGSGVSR